MKITDLLTTEQWIEFEKDLHERFGLNAGVTDENGVRITSYANWANKLCPAIKGDPKGLAAICAGAGQHFTRTITETRKPMIDECDAGMVKMAVPVIVDGELLGMAGGCGCLYRDGEVDCFMVNKSIGMDEGEILDKAKDAPVYSKAQVEEMVAYLTERIGKITAG